MELYGIGRCHRPLKYCHSTSVSMAVNDSCFETAQTEPKIDRILGRRVVKKCLLGTVDILIVSCSTNLFWWCPWNILERITSKVKSKICNVLLFLATLSLKIAKKYLFSESDNRLKNLSSKGTIRLYLHYTLRDLNHSRRLLRPGFSS